MSSLRTVLFNSHCSKFFMHIYIPKHHVCCHDPIEHLLFNHQIKEQKEISITKFLICSFLHSLFYMTFDQILLNTLTCLLPYNLCTNKNTHPHIRLSTRISGICRFTTMKVDIFSNYLDHQLHNNNNQLHPHSTLCMYKCYQKTL